LRIIHNDDERVSDLADPTTIRYHSNRVSETL
jgi:hypothetical protein